MPNNNPRGPVGRLLQKRRERRQAQNAETEINAHAERVRTALNQVTSGIANLTIEAARTPLLAGANVVAQRLGDIAALPDFQARAARLMQLDEACRGLQQKVTQAQADIAEARRQLAEWAKTPHATLTGKVNAAPAAVKAAMQAELGRIKTMVDAAEAALGRAEFDVVKAEATKAFFACQAATTRVASLTAVDAVRTPANLDLVKKLQRHEQLKPQADALDTLMQEAERLIAAADPANDARLGTLEHEIKQAARTLTKSNASVNEYEQQRHEIEALLKGLRAHDKTASIAPQIDQIDAGLKAADKLGAKSDGGWHRALVSVPALRAQCARAKELADKFAAEGEVQLPLLKKMLDGQKDVPPDQVEAVATLAYKLMIETDGNPVTVIKMAKSAHKFKGEGLSEPDALLSAQVKNRLLADGSITEEHAHAIGKNVRGRGTATLDDVNGVAEGVKKMSKEALDLLNASGVTTGVCRGPVTDMMPELHDVQPRGWGDATWDIVPGCYSGSTQTVLIGTMDDGGKRKVPGSGEGGAVTHGASDLIGHEGGHALDVAGGANRRNHADFVAARTQDLAVAGANGLLHAANNYFLTRDELAGATQANMDAALSETFAESYALYIIGNTTRWPNLMAFWANNPWNI